jgi:hypothetical protein
MEHERARELLTRQFTEGALARAMQRDLRDHVRACAGCKAEYDRLFQVERALEGGVAVPRASIERLLVELPAQRRGAIRRRPHWSVRRFVASIAACAALLVAALIMNPSRQPAEWSEWAARGGTKRAWISIFVMRGDEVTALGSTLESDDTLLFAYTNLEDSGARHLAIAGRDAAGHVHWYHPSYRSGEDRPRSIAIEESAGRELAEAVRSEHAKGKLEICALFSEEPLSIADVDRRLESGGGWPDVLRDCREVLVR